LCYTRKQRAEHLPSRVKFKPFRGTARRRHFTKYFISTKLPMSSTMKITVKSSRYLSSNRLIGGPKK